MTRNMEICREFVQLAMENYTKEHSVSYYAKRLNITLQHFCYVIKKVSGRTALDILSNIIIMDAKAQIKSTDMPVSYTHLTQPAPAPAFCLIFVCVLKS